MDGRVTFYRTLVVVFTLLGLLLFWRLGEIVVVLFGAIIFASTIRPIVRWLNQRGLPRGPAILLVYVAVLGGIGGLLAISLPPLVGVGQTLLSEGAIIPQLAATIYSWANRLGYQELGLEAIRRLFEAERALPGQVEELAAREGLPALRTVAEGVGQLFLALVMAFYWLTARDQMEGLLLAMTPRRHRERVETIFNDIEATLGAYLRGTGILMLSIGVSAFVGLLLLRVPYALPLAVVAGLMEGVPLVGATLGAVPAVLIAFTVSPVTGLLTVLLFVLIQFAENNILVPRVMEGSVGLNPLLVIVAIVAGSTLSGILGALLAIPVAGALQVIARHMVIDPMIREAESHRVEQGVPIFTTDDVVSSTDRTPDIIVP